MSPYQKIQIEFECRGTVTRKISLFGKMQRGSSPSLLTWMTWSIKLFWRGSDIKNLIPLIIKSHWICDWYIWHSNFSNQDNDLLSISELFDARKCRISDIINHNESQEYELSYWYMYMYTEVNRIFDWKKRSAKLIFWTWSEDEFLIRTEIIFWNEKSRFWDQKILFWYSNFFFFRRYFFSDISQIML